VTKEQVQMVVFLAIVGGAMLVYFRFKRAQKGDPAWKERWLALSDEERLRIAAAAERGDRAASPEEARLMEGVVKARLAIWSVRSPFEWIPAILGVVLLAIGVADRSFPAFALGVIAVALCLIQLSRRRSALADLHRVEGQTEREAAAPPSPRPPPPSPPRT
jgi:hypothetical protein